MSYLKSKKRATKYDKESIELRKELDMLSKKSKDEFDALEKSNKTEFLLREGLPAPNLKKGTEKNKDFGQSTCKLNAEGEADDLLQVNLTNKQRKPQRSFSASSTIFTQGMSKTKGNEDLKTKTRLHEKGVVSIRPDNPDLKVVMQGRKVPKKMKNTSALKPEDEEQKFNTEPDSADIFFYQSLSPVNIPTNVPAKFAIMGSQNTSMPVPLAPRRQLDARALNSVNSFNTQGLDEDDAFLFPWSSEGSESRATLVSDEDTIKKEDKETENERSNSNLKAKIVDDTVSEERGRRTGGDGHSFSEDLPKKTQEMTSMKLGEVTVYAKGKVASDMDDNAIGFEQRASMLTKSENEINKPKDTTKMNVVDEVDDELLVEMDKIKLKGLEEERTVTLKTEQKSEVGSPITDTTIETKIKSVPAEVSNNEVVKTRVEVIEKSKKDEDNADMDSEELLKFELSLPLKVAVSDIVNVSGKKATFVEKPSHLQEKKYITVSPQSHDEVTFLSTWQDKRIPASMKTGGTSAMNIHHFCSQNTTVELPAHLTRVSRDMHTVDKHRAVAQRYRTPQETLPRVLPTLEGLPRCKHFDADEDWQVAAGEYVFERRLSEVADNILMNVADQGDTLENLRDAANKMFSGAIDEPLNVQGTKIDLKDDSTRFYWSPAPPKLHLPPSFVRDQMFPAYQGAPVLKEILETEYGSIETVDDDSEDDESNVDKMDPEDREARERVLQRTHGSLSNIMDQLSRKPPKSVTDGQIKLSDGPSSVMMDVNKGESDEEIESERFLSVLDVRRQMGKIRESLRIVQTTTKESDDSEWFSSLETERRPQSQPDLSNELSLCVPSDYRTSMQELEEQAALVSAIKSERKSPMLSEKPLSPKDETSEEKRDLCNRSCSLTTDSAHQESYAERREDAVTDTNSVITTTSRGVLSTRKTGKISRKSYLTHARKTRKDPLDDQERMRRKKRLQKKVQELLNQPPRMITRSESLHSLSDKRMLRRSSSLPCLMDHQSLNNENISEYDLFFWIQDEYWYKWLDEVYPPSSAPPDILRDMMSSLSARNKSNSSRISSNVLDEIEVIEPHIDKDKKQLYEDLTLSNARRFAYQLEAAGAQLAKLSDLENEVEKLSEWINQTENQETLALYLSRRGAIYRKLGLLKKAWDDLQRSIKLEPQLVDSRWHRHLLFLLNDKPKKALEDLTFIIKNNSKIVKAYRSKAEIYRKEGDTTMAILNYSQAIKLKPDEADIYYRRASVFESRGDVILALEDYKTAAELLPSKTEAMFNIGQYYFNQKNWQAALISFTKILKQDPLDAKAYLYRGKVCAKQSAFNESLKDLSCAIHLDPMSTEAFYNRGCLLRKIHPQKALQDLSVSLLLDSRVENVNAFLHRGIIYTDLKRWDEAVSDFESALRLDKCIPSAHVNIGLILITKHENYARAIKRFSSAVRVDPSYIRSYVCRANAYDKVGNLKESIHDYTRAIHVRPDVADYRMARGKLLLKQNKLELASFHIRQGAELSQDLGGSATQQAVVHAFLKDYGRAVDILTKTTRINPTAPMFILLGKICMKAKQFENAIASFKRAIYVLTPWHPRMEMPLSAASVYFMIGACFTELNNLVSALDAFNNAIKVNPEDAEAYYNRGLTKMKLRHAKSIHDFNRALAINPKLFQAFLSRAAYYGMKGRFSKGIMNCNEAIKLQPRSVRAYLYRGALKFHISAYKLAVRDLTEAIAIDCTCSLAYFNRAVCYQAMKFYQKALIDYSTVLLSNDEPDLKVLQNRGLLYLDINDIQNAVKDFNDAAKVSPDNPKVLHTLGLCYHKLNRLQDAVSSYTEALKVDPFFIEAYIGRGNTLMDYGHNIATRYGRCDYLKALHIDPLCLPARVNLAYNLQVESKFQQAWDQFTCALTINKDCQAALEGRAIVNLQMGNTFGAFVDMNDCIKVAKTAELLTNRGVVQQFMGDTVNAMRDYQAAIQRDPSYSLAYYNAANLYFKQRQFKQALVYYEKASSWDPQDESAILNTAITKVLLKQFQPALRDFQKAIDLSPYSAHIYFNRGNLYASLGQYESAENDYTHALHLRPGDALTYKRRADVRGKLSRHEEAIQDYKMAIVIQTSVRPK